MAQYVVYIWDTSYWSNTNFDKVKKDVLEPSVSLEEKIKNNYKKNTLRGFEIEFVYDILDPGYEHEYLPTSQIVRVKKNED